MTKAKKPRASKGAPPVPAARAPWARRAVIAAVPLLLIASAVAVWRYVPGAGWRGGAAHAPQGTFVGRAACAACHAREDSLWRGSHHDLAMQPATAATVLGDFKSAKYTHFGVTSTFTTRDGKFFVNTDGPDGAMHDYEIAYTFGVYPLQQYLIAFPGGRYQALNVVWDTRPAKEGGQRWFHLYPKEAVAHDDVLHWTGAYQNWNFMCAECHSTNVAKGYDAATNSYHTTFSEVNVSCEACHGPGSAHAAWAKTGAKTGDPGLPVRMRDSVPATWIVDAATGLPHRSTPRTSSAEVEMCARCHARRSVLAAEYTPGRPLADTHRPSALEDRLYFADGQIREEVYEYASFRQSRMYHNGVTCSDCHDPHTATIAAPVDAVCARCHAPAKFAVESHTHHKAGGGGSSCVACHMPTRDYMVVHARHDHSIRVPRPDLSAALDAPNACAGCHANKGAPWAASAFAKWWPKRAAEPHFGEAIAAGRRGAQGGIAALAALAGDSTVPAIVRATAVELLARSVSPQSLPAIQRALWDSDPLVRDAAIGAASSLPPADRVPMLAPLLTDSVRLVRADAARALAPAAPSMFKPDQRAAFPAALSEYREEQRVNADRAEARLNLGAFFAETGQLDSAAAEYQTALKMNPALLATYVNLADLYRQQGRDADAERTLLDGLARAPKGEGAELQYALGLTYVRQKRMADAVTPLAAAAKLAPDNARYALVLGLALQRLGHNDEAKAVLERALARHPDDRELQSAYVSLVRPNG
jgi:tetratricopeptide (TPR) repeat protein